MALYSQLVDTINGNLLTCPCNNCRAEGQQEGLQYNGEAAGWKVMSDIL